MVVIIGTNISWHHAAVCVDAFTLPRRVKETQGNELLSNVDINECVVHTRPLWVANRTSLTKLLKKRRRRRVAQGEGDLSRDEALGRDPAHRNIPPNPLGEISPPS